VKFTSLKDSRVLILDDQQNNLHALAAVIEFAGCEHIKCLNDSRVALATFLEFQPDLILLDLHMPHLDGLAVMDQLRTVVPAEDYLPILVLTGDSSSAAKENVLARGASDFLSKPLNHTEVELRVKNLLHTRWLHQQLKKQNLSLSKAKEEAERANHAKSEYLSRMSHELRTPLNSILGFAQLLELDPLAPGQRDSVAYIMKGGQHLLSLVNELLDLARIEAGRLSLSPEPVQLDDVIDDALAFVRPIAQRSNIEIKFERTPEGQKHVKADQQRLRQVLLNLFSNAVKYNKEGGGVDIWCEPRKGEPLKGNVLRVSIRDTGHGISAEQQKRLFQPFERVCDETMGIEGTGLGLALSKGLMEAMNGCIGVESDAGNGSTFWIELEEAGGPHDASVVRLDEPHAEEGTLYVQERTVLYIEDNQANFKLMERIVSRRSELRLIGADRGQRGVEAAKAHHPDLILVDLHLPDISGRDVLEQLAIDERTSSIPVVVVSADATPEQIERLRAAGAMSYLTKPLDVASMLKLFDTVFTQPVAVQF
jgi:signal transduction histidine kinase